MIKSKALTVPTEFTCVLDGSGTTGLSMGDSAQLDFGIYNFSLALKFSLPDFTPSADKVVYHKHDGSNGLIVTVLTTGIIRLTINATNYDSTVAPTTIPGKKYELGIGVTRESASVAGAVVYAWNGVVLGTSVAITAGAPATVSNASTAYLMGTSVAQTAGQVSKFVPYNRALSVAEFLARFNSGVATADQYGSNTALYSSNFSAGVDGWTGSSGSVTVAGNVDGINGSDNWCSVTRITTTGSSNAEKILAISAQTRRFAVSVYNPSGSPISYFRVAFLADIVGAVTTAVFPAPSNTQTDAVLFLETSAAADIAIVPCDSSGAVLSVAAGTVYYFKDATVAETGATAQLIPSGLTVTDWQDASTNNVDASFPGTGSSVRCEIV